MKGVERSRPPGRQHRRVDGGRDGRGRGGVAAGVARCAGPLRRRDQAKDVLTIPVVQALPGPRPATPRSSTPRNSPPRPVARVAGPAPADPGAFGRRPAVVDDHLGRAPLAGRARSAGLATLACVEAKGEPTPDEILEDQLVENAVRSDLKPIEQANAYKAPDGPPRLLGPASSPTSSPCPTSA